MSAADVYDLARETFPSVKASWRQRLEALDSSYSLDELTFAFGEARERSAGDLSYVEGILKNRAEQRRTEREQAEPQSQSAYAKDAERYDAIRHVHVLAENPAYQGEAPAVFEDEIRPFTNGTLRWWHHSPACQKNAKNRALVERILTERGASP